MTYIVDFSGFKSEVSQLWSFFISHSLSARSRNVTYIVHFSGSTLPRTLFGTQQKCDIHHLSVSGFKSENSQLWSFFDSYAIQHTAEMWLSYIFWFTKWKSQVWSFSVSNSTQHAAKIWHTSLIFLGFETENHQVWSISILYSIQHLRELRQIFYPSRPVINVISVLNTNLFCKRRILINGN